jgi:hypothetical protein
MGLDILAHPDLHGPGTGALLSLRQGVDLLQ